MLATKLLSVISPMPGKELPSPRSDTIIYTKLISGVIQVRGNANYWFWHGRIAALTQRSAAQLVHDALQTKFQLSFNLQTNILSNLSNFRHF